MGMLNPHNPEKALWDAYMAWTTNWTNDPHNKDARANMEYYYDQWVKQCEKRVVIALKEHKIKDTAGDKLPKVKPKRDPLKS